MIEAATARTPVCPCAIDSVLLIRQSARRMLSAVQEYRGSTVLVPAEAARESPKVYQNAAAKQARRESRAAARLMRSADSGRAAGGEPSAPRVPEGRFSPSCARDAAGIRNAPTGARYPVGAATGAGAVTR